MSAYVTEFFAAAAAATGGVIRRKESDVDRVGALPEILQEARDRGWHVIRTGDQIVVLCHPGEVNILC
ncbi:MULTISPECIES: N-(5'-phosphoribosyl)anthranilate isomerase [Clavibacter]|uniref:N-(5'-phosphoribosyl)anthranilate isomerase n=1 Tax=Clavibacter seminis TaxID=2860285 RepID=A0ABY3TCN4_9MICO|nr:MULTISPECIES: N-(5'-phosphoribosyl)anthranilate isomerase [Clavibacter]UKF26682.1 hypothetical protein KYT88_15815 [Clavibacter sp. A6099]